MDPLLAYNCFKTISRLARDLAIPHTAHTSEPIEEKFSWELIIVKRNCLLLETISEETAGG